MANRFVSAGTAEEPPERDEEWLAAQKELDSKAQQRKQAEANQGSGLQEGGKTLYETLQANKAAKQDAFEESAKLKNQFRSLDDDEIDFLDEVLDSTRRKEQEVKKDNAEQLDAFRRQREEAEKAGATIDAVEDDQDEVLTWKAGPRKRKKSQVANKAGPKPKLRKMSSTANESLQSPLNDEPSKSSEGTSAVKATHTPSKLSNEGTESLKTSEAAKVDVSPPPVGLGLDAYSSDED